MKILISTPAYNHQVTSEMANSLLIEGQELVKSNHAFNWHTPVSSVLSYSRNLSCDLALKEGYDWLLFWDGDIEVENRGFIDIMIKEAARHEAMIVGVPVFLKGEPKTLNCANKVDNLYHNFTELSLQTFAVDVIGTGVMLINVELLRRMKPPYFSFIDTYHDKAGFWPEDWNFCQNAAMYTKTIATPFKTKHWGLCAY